MKLGRKLDFTWGPQGKIRITFSEKDKGLKLLIHHFFVILK